MNKINIIMEKEKSTSLYDDIYLQMLRSPSMPEVCTCAIISSLSYKPETYCVEVLVLQKQGSAISLMTKKYEDEERADNYQKAQEFVKILLGTEAVAYDPESDVLNSPFAKSLESRLK
jgi:hypothetical protein